jgi:RNA recognition motif-containing protein
VTALFVRNLTLDMSQQRLREIFYKHTNVPILKLKKISHFAFIHYENRKAAQTVIDIMQSEYANDIKMNIINIMIILMNI